jgi:hypothetical protein
MNKLSSELNKQFSKVQMANKNKEILSVLGHKRNANYNDTEISPHSSQNGYQ